MARSEARRQKQLQKKKAKRSARQGALKRLKSQSPAQRIVAARSVVRHCLLQRDDLEDKGIGSALFSVELPSGEIGTVVFLIDRYCLGVKDVFGRVMHASDYSNWIDEFRDRTDAVSIAPATLRRLVDDVVAFARSCGLSPHPDYNKWRVVLSDVDPEQASETFEMGRDGKPWFMAGPFDSESRCRAVVAKLEEHCGPGNYDYVVQVGPDSELLDEFDDDWEDEFDDEDEWEAGRIEYYDEPHV